MEQEGENKKKNNFNLHPAQIEIVKDKHRFRVINAGRRFGKSTLVAWEMFAIAASTDNARVVYYAPTREDARNIMWKTIKDISKPLMIGDGNESRLEIVIKNRFGTTSLIALYGWEALQERGQGVGVRNNHIFLDEVSKYRNFTFGWEEILRPTLIDVQGGATFISTPNGFNHFYDLTLMEGKSPDYKYFHFTSWDNPHLSPEELALMRAEMGEDRYAQEIMGEFRKREGLVYKEFDRTKHVVKELPEDFEPLYKYGGVDWGHTHPCAVITIQKDYSGNYWITDEFYKTGQTESQIIDRVVANEYHKVFPDPENASGVEALRRAGVNIREVNKSKGSVQSGISKVQELFRQGRLKVLSHCTNVISEFEGYAYPDENKRGITENPLKEGDDAMDAIRYVIMSDIDSAHATGAQVHYGKAKTFGTYINPNKFGGTA
jgi:PBSX family phage terminase large subunit